MPATLNHGFACACANCRAAYSVWSGLQHPWSTPSDTSTRVLEVGIKGRRLEIEEGGAGDYGLYLWPAGVVLASYLGTLKLAGQTLLDVGAGLGVAGIAAALGGARLVVWNDRSPRVCERLRRTIDRYAIPGVVHEGDWCDLEAKFDTLVGSYVLYEPQGVKDLAETIKRCWTGKGPLIFAEPRRFQHDFDKLLGGLGVPLEQFDIEGKLLDGRPYVCALWQNDGGAAASL